MERKKLFDNNRDRVVIDSYSENEIDIRIGDNCEDIDCKRLIISLATAEDLVEGLKFSIAKMKAQGNGADGQ